MTEIRLLDYSFSHPTPAAIKASGAVGVMRYLTHSESAKKLTAAEVKGLHAAGLSIGVVFEDVAGRAKQGRPAGRADALYAEGLAKQLGVPVAVPIFFAVDFDTTPAAVLAYFRGLDAKIAHPIGVYGSQSVVDGLMAGGVAKFGWQTAAWSHGKESTRAHLFQRVHPTHPVSGTDENVLRHAFPLWTAAAPAKAPAAKTAPKVTPAKPAPTPAKKAPPAPAKKAAPVPAKKAAAKPVAKPKLAPYRYRRTLKLGCIGGDVCHLQRRLGMHVTGFYGVRTRDRVKAAQRAHGLIADGVYGPESQKRFG